MLLKGNVGGAGGLLTGWGQSGPRDLTGFNVTHKAVLDEGVGQGGEGIPVRGKMP